MIKNLENYLIDNNVFLDHIIHKGHIIKQDVNNELEDHCKYIKDTHNIYIHPYCYLVEESEHKHIFYVFLNFYMSDDKGIKKFTDIKTMYDVLCYVFMVQYYFL